MISMRTLISEWDLASSYFLLKKKKGRLNEITSRVSLVAAILELYLAIFIKMEHIYTLLWSIPLLDMYLPDKCTYTSHIQEGTRQQKFVTAPNWKLPKCPQQ